MSKVTAMEGRLQFTITGVPTGITEMPDKNTIQ